MRKLTAILLIIMLLTPTTIQAKERLMGTYRISAYCIEPYKHICGNGKGITATGTEAIPWKTIATDPDVIPHGSKVRIEGLEEIHIAEDTGGGIYGERIDLCVCTHQQGLNWGIQYRRVWIVE